MLFQTSFIGGAFGVVGEESIRRDFRLSGLIGEDLGIGSGVSDRSETEGDGEDFDFFDGFGGNRAIVDPMLPLRRLFVVDFLSGKIDPELEGEDFTTEIDRFSWLSGWTL